MWAKVPQERRLVGVAVMAGHAHVVERDSATPRGLAALHAPSLCMVPPPISLLFSQRSAGHGPCPRAMPLLQLVLEFPSSVMPQPLSYP